ncbi:MAG: hypothetical protein NTY19_33895, partial [Planctomycetota bacterium]|nr:hypothetical protein [Planctomycetota bacterium]
LWSSQYFVRFPQHPEPVATRAEITSRFVGRTKWRGVLGAEDNVVITRRGCEEIVGWAKYSRPTIESKAISLELVGREYLAHPTVNRVRTFFHSLGA